MAYIFPQLYACFAEAREGDADLLAGKKPDQASHSVKRHGVIGSIPRQQLPTHTNARITADIMHTGGGAIKNLWQGLLGTDLTDSVLLYELKTNER